MVDTMISSTSLPTSTEWWSRPRETGPRQKTVIRRPTHLADSIVAPGCTWIYIHPAILLLPCVASIMLLQHDVQMATRMLCSCEYTMFEGWGEGLDGHDWDKHDQSGHIHLNQHVHKNLGTGLCTQHTWIDDCHHQYSELIYYCRKIIFQLRYVTWIKFQYHPQSSRVL